MGKNRFLNILYYGDFDCSTGYGMVSKNLIDNWSKIIGDKGLITVFALNNFEKEDYEYKKNVFVIPALKTRQKNDTDSFARNSFLKLLYNGNYTHLFCNNDVEVFNGLTKFLLQIKEDKKKENRPKIKSVLYFPIDSPVRKKDLEVLKFFDKAVTYTEYAKTIIKDLVYPNIFKKVSVLPHGTNTKDFFPINNKEIEDLKNKYFKNNSSKYIFGTVNRNSARKDMSTLMISYSEFVKEQKNTLLYIHANPKDKYGVNLHRLAERLDLVEGENIIFADNNVSEKNKEEFGVTTYSLKMLNELYNCFDCFVTTTTAEGWGLTVTEAMATKTKVICPIHTSLSEITNYGELVIPLNRLSKVVYVNDYDKIRYKSDSGELISAMKTALSTDKKNLATLSYEKVVKLKWEDISLKFYNLIKSI